MELAIEHTLIEAFTSQLEDGLRFKAFVEPIEDAFITGLPGRYQLTMKSGSLAGIPTQRIPEIRAALIDWIGRTAPLLGDSPPKHFIRTAPAGVPFEVGLYKLKVSWRRCLVAMREIPSDLEKKRAERIGRALDPSQSFDDNGVILMKVRLCHKFRPIDIVSKVYSPIGGLSSTFNPHYLTWQTLLVVRKLTLTHRANA